MPRADQVFAKFHAVATGTLRLPPEVADEFASHVAPVTEIGTATALLPHARVFEVGVAQLRLADSEALQLATHVRQAASAFYALDRPLADASEAAAVLCLRQDEGR